MAQAQVHCQKQHEGKLARSSFSYSTSTSALPKTTLHCEANPLQRNTLHREQKLARFSFPCGISTTALTKATLHSERNLTHAIFPSIVKASQHMLAHFIAQIGRAHV